jgi:O-antigen/teichoic acid export membrane protein
MTLLRAVWPRRAKGATSTFGSAVPVAVGLGIQSATAYLTLILAGRLLGAAEFGGLAALYVLLSTVATGLFLPLEQEIARRRGRERETGSHDGSVVWRAAVLGGWLCLIVVGGALALWHLTVGLLGGHPQLLAAFCFALPGYALCFVGRGVLSGTHRLRRYGLLLAVDGSFRLVGLALLAALGVRSTVAYGWLFAFAPWIALGAAMVGLRAVPRDRTVAEPMVRPLAWLLTSSLAMQLLIGAGPLTAQYFADGRDAARAGAFVAALVIVRVPVVLFSAVQPSMLPAMAAHAAAGRRSDFAVLFGRVLVAMVGVALVTTLAFTALGPWALKLLFGSDFILSWSVFLIMAISVGLFMVAVVLGQAVLALGEHRRVAIGWLAGLCGLGIGISLASDPLLKANLGLLVGAGTVVAIFSVVLWRLVVRRRATRSTGAFVNVIDGDGEVATATQIGSM